MLERNNAVDHTPLKERVTEIKVVKLDICGLLSRTCNSRSHRVIKL